MKFRLGVCTLVSLFAVGALVTSAQAAYDLRITEIWPGQSGTDITNDWFEITNYGDMAWVSGVDVNLFVDDGSASFANAAQIFDITDIQPGESAIVLMEGDGADKTTFFNAWNPVKPQALSNIGFADGNGLGLGQPSDGVVLFDGSTMNPIDFASYGSSTTAQSWDVALQAYSVVGNGSGAVASFALGGANLDTPAIGSPGMVVPEPASVVMILIGGALLAARRRNA